MSNKKKIVDNKYLGADFRKSPNTSGVIKQKKFIVLHEDIGTWFGTTSWLMNPSAKVSYHLYISKQGEVRQFVELNKRAWHAGVSEWKGYKNLNDYSIGVCFQNRGGEPYTEAQLNKGVEVCQALMDELGYEEVTRHRDIAPNRKTDPNPPFPWEEFKQRLSGGNLYIKHTTSNLNLRSGVGTSNPVIKVLPKGSKVHILNNPVNGWVEVLDCESNQKGFVSTTYLK